MGTTFFPHSPAVHKGDRMMCVNAVLPINSVLPLKEEASYRIDRCSGSEAA